MPSWPQLPAVIRRKVIGNFLLSFDAYVNGYFKRKMPENVLCVIRVARAFFVPNIESQILGFPWNVAI